MPKSRWLAAVFFAAVLMLGLWTAGDYGPSWDEQSEMDILRLNLWEYARLLHLPEENFEAFAHRENRVLPLEWVPISQSEEQDHGIALFYPMAGVVMNREMSEAEASIYWHMWCWVTFVLGAYALYASCRELGMEPGASLVAPVLLLLSPRFFAQGHINNKDIAMFSITAVVLWRALALARRPKLTMASGLWFALAGALATSSKVAGAAIWGLCGICALICRALDGRLDRRTWLVAGSSLAAFVGIYALITPALWADPVGFLNYLVVNAFAYHRWTGYVLFRGMVFNTYSQPLPWYYLPYMILGTTPLWVLALIGVGSVQACASLIRKKMGHAEKVRLLMVLLVFAFPLGTALITHTRVYNGWRHFYFVYGPLLILAAWGTSQWRKQLPHRLYQALAVLVCVCAVWQGVGMVREHPYQYTYYQPLAQMRGADYNELDYWNVSARDALTELASQTEGEIRIGACDGWSRIGLRKALAGMEPETAKRFTWVIEESADYLLSNPTYAFIDGSELPEDAGEKVVIRAYGQPIMRILKKTEIR